MLKVIGRVRHIVGGKLVEPLATKVWYIRRLRGVQLSKSGVLAQLSDSVKPLCAHLCRIETCPNAEFLGLTEALASQWVRFVGRVDFLLLIEICTSIL